MRDTHSLDALTEALATAAPCFDDDTSMPVEEVRSRLDDWTGIFRIDDYNIIGFWGLALTETSHRLTVDGVQLYAWCAWDTLFLPAILDADAVIHSVDPNTGEPVTLTVTPDAVREHSPDGIVMSFLAPPSHPAQIGSGARRSNTHRQTWRRFGGARAPVGILTHVESAGRSAVPARA